MGSKWAFMMLSCLLNVLLCCPTSGKERDGMVKRLLSLLLAGSMLLSCGLASAEPSSSLSKEEKEAKKQQKT